MRRRRQLSIEFLSQENSTATNVFMKFAHRRDESILRKTQTMMNVKTVGALRCQLTVPHLSEACPEMFAEPPEPCAHHPGIALPASNSNFVSALSQILMQNRRSSHDPGIGIYYYIVGGYTPRRLEKQCLEESTGKGFLCSCSFRRNFRHTTVA